MESLELRIFREAALSKSISKAATNLNYVQSNITAHIRKLEEELGTALFIRHGKGVTLTEDGEKLLHYADTILGMMDHALSAFQKDCDTLQIGASQTLAASRLPIWISAFRKLYPDIRLSVITGSQDKLIQDLKDHVLDCVFVEPRYISHQVKSIFSFTEELSIIAPLESSLQLLPFHPIVVNALATCPFRRQLADWSFSQNHEEPAVIEFDTAEAIINAVSLGMGISLLPTSLIAGKDNLTTYQIPEIKSMDLHMVTNCAEQSRQVSQFRDITASFY
ncbi:LysR family transcriptional regulator [uncultured Robinsoniella sp.]|uniref:LysR family transcriptional regulator n=1 Tax=uncultured Robinsoniella sp. TaxID=904190 RepID=UPI00374E4445